VSRFVFAAGLLFGELALGEPAGFALDAGGFAAVVRPLARLAAKRSDCLRTGRMRGRGSFLARGVLGATVAPVLAVRVAAFGLAAAGAGALLARRPCDALVERVCLAVAALVAGFADALAMLRGARALATGLSARTLDGWALDGWALDGWALDALAFDAAGLAAADLVVVRDGAGLAAADFRGDVLPFAILPVAALALGLVTCALAVAVLPVAVFAVAVFAVAVFAVAVFAVTVFAVTVLAAVRDDALTAGAVEARVPAVLRPSVRIAIGCARRLAESRSR